MIEIYWNILEPSGTWNKFRAVVECCRLARCVPLAMRHDDDHQALLAVRRGEWVAKVYDGLCKKSISQAAKQACKTIGQLIMHVEPRPPGSALVCKACLRL